MRIHLVSKRMGVKPITDDNEECEGWAGWGLESNSGTPN